MIAHPKVETGSLADDALWVGEGVKALLAVVGAHAALAYAADGELRAGQMDDGIVDIAAVANAVGDFAGGVRTRFPLANRRVLRIR